MCDRKKHEICSSRLAWWFYLLRNLKHKKEGSQISKMLASQKLNIQFENHHQFVYMDKIFGLFSGLKVTQLIFDANIC